MIVRKLKKQRGMAATEYIIGLILVAVGAVGMFTIFGSQIRNKIGQVTAAISGDSAEMQNAGTRETNLKTVNATEGAKTNSMSNTNVDVGPH